MNKHVPRLAGLWVGLMLLVSANSYAVGSENSHGCNNWAKEATQLHKEQQYQQAIALTKQAIRREPETWLPHALLSFFCWQDSNASEAITEGKIAARLAPHNALVLMNLGHMLVLSGAPEDAAHIFDKAKKLNPTDRTPWIGQAESLALADRREESFSVLHDMSCKNSTDSNWYYAIGQDYLVLDRPDFAIDMAGKSMSVAKSPDEKYRSVVQLFLADLRSGQVEHARALQDQVYCSNGTSDAQVYILGASALLHSLDPGGATKLLNAAIGNLKKSEDADSFFRLARIFEEKASLVSYDRTTYSAWLDNEEVAYRQSIKLHPEPSIYHLGLSSILGQKNMTEEMVQELFKAHSNEPLDQLTGYMLSRLTPAQNRATENGLQSANTAPASSSSIKLTKAQIRIKGVNCSCKRGAILQSFRRCRGIVFSSISPHLPYKATVLIDESMISVADALDKLTGTKPDPNASYELISTEPVNNAGIALQIDEQSRTVNYMSFNNSFQKVEPTSPVGLDPTIVAK